MKTLIVILIIAAFFQTTILPVDLVLLILICRAYLINEKANLYLAFAFGLFASHLNLTMMGLQSLIYLAITESTQILSRLRLAGNPLLLVPVTFFFLFLIQIISSQFTHSNIEFVKIIFESLLSLPAYYMLRMWEERFIVRKEIKLRV